MLGTTLASSLLASLKKATPQTPQVPVQPYPPFSLPSDPEAGPPGPHLAGDPGPRELRGAPVPQRLRHGEGKATAFVLFGVGGGGVQQGMRECLLFFSTEAFLSTEFVGGGGVVFTKE